MAKLAGEEAPRPAADTPPRAAAPPHRHISAFVLLMFSFLPPGVSYMYEGLIKRGLAAMSAFFLLVFFSSQFTMWPLSLLLALTYPVLIITCIFDAFNIRRRLNAGEYVKDDIDDVISFARRNKRLFIAFLGLILALSLLNGLSGLFPGSFGRYIVYGLICLGLFTIIKRPRHASPKKRDDNNTEE